jgi:hypothetical protein
MVVPLQVRVVRWNPVELRMCKKSFDPRYGLLRRGTTDSYASASRNPI